MCVAYPGTVEKIEDDMAVVDFAGNKVRASCAMADVKEGDRVLVHAGCIIQVIRKDEAEEIEELFAEINAMESINIIELKQSIYEDNDREAEELRDDLTQKGIFLINLMSSPGAGKTTVLTRTVEALKDEISIGIMEADIDSDVDARTLSAAGVEAIQLHTGGMCHLDAGMTAQGLENLREKHDIVVLENVGNLVCPAEFDTGAHKNVMILSVPEGDDKPLKYPLMFSICDVVLINKVDTMPMFDFDMERCRENILARNPNAVIIPLCAKDGSGFEPWIDWLRSCAVRS